MWADPTRFMGQISRQREAVQASRREVGMSLNGKQERFVEEYIIDLNATQAAIRAGYSKKTAGQQGFALLKNPQIQALLSKAIESRSKRTEITQDRVLAELAKVGFSDLRKTMTDGGHLMAPDCWDESTAGAISSIEVVVKPTGLADEDGSRQVEHVHKIKVWDKMSALDKLARHLGMYQDGGDDDDATIADAINNIADKLPS